MQAARSANNEDNAFVNCISLTSVEIPDSVTTIGRAAFHTCSSLTGITIPAGVTEIGEYTFCNCSSLTSILIPDSVITIDASAFLRCPNLTIYANAGSYAETYAKESKLPFVALSE